MPTQFELIQQVRTIRAIIDTFINTAERFPVKSREISLCRTELQRAKHFLGLYLSLCMEAENPYPNSSDSTNTIIEPQAEHNNFDLFNVFNELGCDDEHVKMVKEFRQQIENCFNHYFDDNFICMSHNYQKHECKIIKPTFYFQQSFLALKEAKMWLGWELDRIRKESEEKQTDPGTTMIRTELTPQIESILDEIHPGTTMIRTEPLSNRERNPFSVKSEATTTMILTDTGTIKLNNLKEEMLPVVDEVKQPDNFVNNLIQKVNPESKVFTWTVSTSKDIENGELPVYSLIFIHAKNLHEARIKANQKLPELLNVERLLPHIELSNPILEDVPFNVFTESYTHNKEQIEKFQEYKDKTDLN